MWCHENNLNVNNANELRKHKREPSPSSIDGEDAEVIRIRVPGILSMFYSSTIKRALTSCIGAWNGSCRGWCRLAKSIVRLVTEVCFTPSRKYTVQAVCVAKARQIIKDKVYHPSHNAATTVCKNLCEVEAQ